MILPVSDAPEWSSDNASELNAFLTSSSGEKLLQLLSYYAPVLLDGADVNKTLVASGEVKGYMSAVSLLVSLKHSRPEEAQGILENYPSLDDDSKWEESTTQT